MKEDSKKKENELFVKYVQKFFKTCIEFKISLINDIDFTDNEIEKENIAATLFYPIFLCNLSRTIDTYKNELQVPMLKVAYEHIKNEIDKRRNGENHN